MFDGQDWGKAFLFLGVICGLIGWGSIEFVIWVFSFIHISIG